MPQNRTSSSPFTDLGKAIREIAPTTVLVRIYPTRRSVTHLFGSDFYRIPTERQSEEIVARLIRERSGNTADWRLAHDFYIPTGAIYLSPEPHQNGYIPEDDQSFGLALSRRIAILDRND